MELRVLDVAFDEIECRTRLPFRFGATVLERAPLLRAAATVETVDGRRATGFAADLLVPKWFRKDPDKSAAEDQDDLRQSARSAAAAYTDPEAGARTPFALWRQVYDRRVGSQPEQAPDLLVRGFGVALVERAMLDAACRAAHKSFFSALRGDLFGFRPAEVHPELADWRWQDLPPPRSSVRVRHTVGMLDPLRRADIPPERRLDDGFPEALEEDIEAYGLVSFKVKVGAGLQADRRRLLELARLFAERDLRPRLTLDGNEQFEDLGQVTELLRAVASDELGARLLACLVCIEQPLPRERTFDPQPNAGIERLSEYAPCILDEADLTVHSFSRALDLGYRGVSVKNCKGVFRALLNRGLCARRPGTFQSAEDLTNLPVLALQQDLCTIAALGLDDVERNGHHYFAGLDHLPPELARAALQAHPDLYRETGRGGVALRIEDGALRIGSLQTPGYGHDLDDPH